MLYVMHPFLYDAHEQELAWFPTVDTDDCAWKVQQGDTSSQSG